MFAMMSINKNKYDDYTYDISFSWTTSTACLLNWTSNKRYFVGKKKGKSIFMKYDE